MQAAADILTLFPKKSQNPNLAQKCPITSIQVCTESQKLSEFSRVTSGSLKRGSHTFQPLFLKITDFCPWERTMREGGMCLDNTTLPAWPVTRNCLRLRHHGLIPMHLVRCLFLLSLLCVAYSCAVVDKKDHTTGAIHNTCNFVQKKTKLRQGL